MCVLPQSYSDTNCNRTTSEMRGLSPKIISGILDEARIHKHNTYKHTIPYEVQVKIIIDYFHILELQEVKLQRILQKISHNLSGSEYFCGSAQLDVIRVITSP
jgi:hypothetical protein